MSLINTFIAALHVVSRADPHHDEVTKAKESSDRIVAASKDLGEKQDELAELVRNVRSASFRGRDQR